MKMQETLLLSLVLLTIWVNSEFGKVEAAVDLCKLFKYFFINFFFNNKNLNRSIMSFFHAFEFIFNKHFKQFLFKAFLF